jgi:3-oxoacyl-[acyl-carrier protein] reductase
MTEIPTTRRLGGHTALITGSGIGMGRSHALALAEAGAAVVVQDIVAETAEETASMVRERRAKAHVMVCDISDVAAVNAGVEAARADLGPIDILVNNAGISGGMAKFDDIDEAYFDRVVAIHLKGTFFTAKAVLPDMRAKGWGRIVNVSSIDGMVGCPSSTHYCAAKAGVLGLAKAWAKEFAPWGITVNAVAPGYIDTPMMDNLLDAAGKAAHVAARIPLGRMGVAADLTAAVAFLVSEEAAFITGQTISPNGGEVIGGF